MYKNGVKFSKIYLKILTAILRFRPLELRLLIEHPVHRFLRTCQSRITRSYLRVCKSQHHRISFSAATRYAFRSQNDKHVHFASGIPAMRMALVSFGSA